MKKKRELVVISDLSSHCHEESREGKRLLFQGGEEQLLGAFNLGLEGIDHVLNVLAQTLQSLRRHVKDERVGKVRGVTLLARKNETGVDALLKVILVHVVPHEVLEGTRLLELQVVTLLVHHVSEHNAVGG